MHFNELILRTRSLGMYGAILVMGTAMYLRNQTPSPAPFHFNLADRLVFDAPTPAVIALFGPVLLLIVYLIDRHYYLRLLYGINTFVYGIERQMEARGLALAGVENAFRQGLDIQKAFGARSGASTRFVKWCYMLVAVVEGIVILLLWTNP